MMRRRMLEEARVVADGGEPKCVYRDPETNQKLYLPRQGRAREEQGLPPGFRNPDPSKAPRNVHLAKQPQWILDEMDNIWGRARRLGRKLHRNCDRVERSRAAG